MHILYAPSLKEARWGSALSSFFPKARDFFWEIELLLSFQISYLVGYAAYKVTLSFHSFLHYT